MSLGQIEAFVPPPTRRLIVPMRHTTFWGVDPSSLRVALALVTADGERRVDTASFDRSRPTVARLPEIRKRTAELAELLLVYGPPGVIVVEKPAGFGKKPNPELAYAAAAIMCGLQEAVPTAVLELVESARWKRVSCGYGAIKKPKPGSGEEYAVLQWARTVGYVGTSYDAVDAMAIAEFARRTFALDAR